MNRLLNDGWSFLRTELDTGYSEIITRTNEFRPVAIPHDWLIIDANHLYEDGCGWYIRNLEIDEEHAPHMFLDFDGVYMDSTIYINDKKAFEWKYGYSEFIFEIMPFLKKGNNQIIVQVRYQSPNSRWYSGAGIYRDVHLICKDNIYLEPRGTYVHITSEKSKEYIVHIENQIYIDDDSNQDVTLSLTQAVVKDNKVIASKTVDIEVVPGSHQVDLDILVENPSVWDIETPICYELATGLVVNGEAIDRSRELIGFRTVEMDPDQGFLLNGRKVKLQGVCEHHDLGALGSEFHKEAMRRKFRILKEMGVNALRTAHNMPAKEVMNLADEMGILVVSEAFDMWEKPKNEYDYARFFKEWMKKDVESWIKRDRNHPSLILWSIGNEIYDTHADTHGQDITRNLLNEVKKHDALGNARVTIGSNFMPWENAQKCADIVKVAGYNYTEKCYEEHHREHPDWVIYGSETVSIPNSRNVYLFPASAPILSDDNEQCSALGNSATSWGARDYTACFLPEKKMDFSMGQFIWTGFDYIGEPTPYKTKNSYFGMIDTAGFPKDSFYIFQSQWRSVKDYPMVHVFPYWDFNNGQMIDLFVCSNGASVELFVNGVSRGVQDLRGDHIIAEFHVPYEKGEIMAVAYNQYGMEIARQVRKSFSDSQRLNIVVEPGAVKSLVADGNDMTFLHISAVDEEGNPVENAADRVEVQVSGAGYLLGLDNGDSSDFDSYKGFEKRLFSGKLLAIIGAGTETGECLVTVSAPGLVSASITIPVKEGTLTEGASPYRNTCLQSAPEGAGVDLQKNRIPVRKVEIIASKGRELDQNNRELFMEAIIHPGNATDKELTWSCVTETGVVTNLAEVQEVGEKDCSHRAVVKALGDGEFRLRVCSKAGTDKVRIISQLELKAENLGQAFMNPYEFVAASLYTGSMGPVSGGIERGVASSNDKEVILIYEHVDFGSFGTDEISIPIFEMEGRKHDIEIWQGVPEEENSELLCHGEYEKPVIWDVYQAESFHLKRRISGVATLSIRVFDRMDIKGFQAKKLNRAYERLNISECDHIYGDSFNVKEDRIEKIGNNVSILFEKMNFNQMPVKHLIISGRCPAGDNTIHVRFTDAEGEKKEIVEFPRCEEYQEKIFDIAPVQGIKTVNFLFMPGSNFDFAWFKFD